MSLPRSLLFRDVRTNNRAPRASGHAFCGHRQYIAQESGNIAMLAELDATLAKPLHGLTQWEQADFAANLIPAFRALFVALGWQQPLATP